jgi:hypothetical protein
MVLWTRTKFNNADLTFGEGNSFRIYGICAHPADEEFG